MKVESERIIRHGMVDISMSPRINTDHLRTSPNSRIESHFMGYHRIMTVYQTYHCRWIYMCVCVCVCVYIYI
jgi:hypothetical protein